MSLIIDLPFIAQEAIDKEEENALFRSFLKTVDISSQELDAIVHEIYDEVAAQIDCTQCANCCKLIHPVLSQEDVDQFAKSLQLSPPDFEKRHLIPSEEQPGKFKFNALPCPFLAGDLCTNYDWRPHDCHSFPHLYRKHFRLRLWGVVFNYELCPIVYHVYERLKEDLWNEDSFEDDGLFDDLF